MTDRTGISVDVISDVVCPWCFIGQKRLKKAIAAVPDVEVTVHWRPYQLDATIPADGLDRKQYMVAKFGGEERLKRAHAQMLEASRDDGIDFALGDIKVSPNTLDAHRVIRWAGGTETNRQDEVVTELFSAFFEQGRNVGDHEVLIDVAGKAGMDAAVVETLLATDSDREAVRAEIETAQRMGITGVPCFLLESRYAVVGAQDAAMLADAIRRVAAAKADGTLDEPRG
ncbi:MAG: DsbA family oxidoreductase [Rhizobiaceae bacterium]|nr:DsbA family oxidoreductase [Rhizobiaceae bacterium]